MRETLPSATLPSTITPDWSFAAQVVHHLAHGGAVRHLNARRDHPHAFDLARLLHQVAGGGSRALHLLRFQFLAELLLAFGELLDGLDQFVGLRAQSLGSLRQRLALPSQVFEHARARQRFDAARARRHAAFGDNLEQADVTRPPHVRAAAEFFREVVTS